MQVPAPNFTPTASTFDQPRQFYFLSRYWFNELVKHLCKLFTFYELPFWCYVNALGMLLSAHTMTNSNSSDWNGRKKDNLKLSNALRMKNFDDYLFNVYWEKLRNIKQIFSFHLVKETLMAYLENVFRTLLTFTRFFLAFWCDAIDEGNLNYANEINS